MKKKAIRILLVDDHLGVLTGTKTYLLSNKGIRVVEQAKNAKEAVQRTKRIRPDIVLLDIDPADVSATETINMLQTALPSARILIHTMHDDREMIRDFIRLGEKGYLSKGCFPAHISRAIEAILASRTYFSPQVSEILNGAIRQETAGSKNTCTLRAATHSDYNLTQKEREILRYIAQGLRMQEIALRVSVRYNTLTTHFKHIYCKLGVHTRGAVVAKTLKENIV